MSDGKQGYNSLFASLQCQLHLVLARSAFQPQDDLLGGLGLLVEDGFGLTSISALLPVVPSLSLCDGRCLPGLVLRHFMRSMELTS